ARHVRKLECFHVPVVVFLHTANEIRICQKRRHVLKTFGSNSHHNSDVANVQHRSERFLPSSGSRLVGDLQQVLRFVDQVQELVSCFELDHVAECAKNSGEIMTAIELFLRDTRKPQVGALQLTTAEKTPGRQDHIAVTTAEILECRLHVG